MKINFYANSQTPWNLPRPLVYGQQGRGTALSKLPQNDFTLSHCLVVPTPGLLKLLFPWPSFLPSACPAPPNTSSRPCAPLLRRPSLLLPLELLPPAALGRRPSLTEPHPLLHNVTSAPSALCPVEFRARADQFLLKCISLIIAPLVRETWFFHKHHTPVLPCLTGGLTFVSSCHPAGTAVAAGLASSLTFRATLESLSHQRLYLVSPSDVCLPSSRTLFLGIPLPASIPRTCANTMMTVHIPPLPALQPPRRWLSRRNYKLAKLHLISSVFQTVGHNPETGQEIYFTGHDQHFFE